LVRVVLVAQQIPLKKMEAKVVIQYLVRLRVQAAALALAEQQILEVVQVVQVVVQVLVSLVHRLLLERQALAVKVTLADQVLALQVLPVAVALVK
tara:strand:- start:263 stop:547 length:285 start_codon:yes stop_codon:yes gene_type:complete